MEKVAYIRHSPCPDGTWAALPFWMRLGTDKIRRLEELLGEGKDFDWRAAKAADRTWAPKLHTAKSEGLPLFLTAAPSDCPPRGLLEGYEVYLLDFCYNKEGLETLISEVGPAGHIIILDHHASNQRVVGQILERHPKTITAIFDMNRSGAEIAWEYSRTQFGYPGHYSGIMRYIGDRDTWKFALPFSREINASLRVRDAARNLGTAMYYHHMECITPGFLALLAEEGKYYLKVHNDHVRSVVSFACTAYVTVTVDGQTEEHHVRVVNSPTFQSEIGCKLASEIDPKVKSVPNFVAVWYYHHASDELRISLRTSRKCIDLSRIAPNIVGVSAGGGHRAAAGCVIKGSDIKAVFRPHPFRCEGTS